MVVYKNGDLLESKCEVICHQVNLDGVMGGGLALQIAKKYPEVEKYYLDFLQSCTNKELLLGEYCVVNGKDGNVKNGIRIIANCFTQRYDFTTDYDAVYKCFEKLKDNMMFAKLKTIGIPYGYGCGIAKGEWGKVSKIIHRVFGTSEIKCEVWKI